LELQKRLLKRVQRQTNPSSPLQQGGGKKGKLNNTNICCFGDKHAQQAKYTTTALYQMEPSSAVKSSSASK
jgi:hypothetical protein